MKLVTNKFKTGGLHEKHIVATSNAKDNYMSLRKIQLHRDQLTVYKVMAAPALCYRIEIYVFKNKKCTHIQAKEVKLLR
jgi:hypothetical protein